MKTGTSIKYDMTKKNFLVNLLLLLSFSSFSQHAYWLKGMITDSVSQMPVPSATITINDPSSGKITTTLTNEKGQFQIKVGGTNNPLLHITCVGYESKLIRLENPFDSNTDSLNLPVIYLVPQQRVLKDVIVTAKKQLVKQEVDRLSYDVQADPDNRSQTVLELMGKVPLLSLDGDENVLLKGSGNYKIFINGKPSSLLAHNPKEALKSMPANAVQRIEVITVPPAKYDAEGLAGIINIVLTKRLKDGYNGTIRINYNHVIGPGESASLSAKAGKFGITASANIYQDYKRSLHKTNTRKSIMPVSSELMQEGVYSYVGNYNSGNMEVSYEADSLNLFTLGVNSYISRYHDRTTLTQDILDESNALISAYQSLNINPQKESGVDVNINYQHGFKNNKDCFFTLSYQLQHFPNAQTSETIFEKKVNYVQDNYFQDSRNGTEQHTIQADYIYPAKKYTVEAGVKAILRHNYSDFNNSVFDTASGIYIPDQAASDRFSYNQGVYSLYNSWQLKLEEIEIKAGVRAEMTDTHGDFYTTNTKLKSNYVNIIPVISLLHRFPHAAIGVGFTQRILRPGIYQLNPFIDRSNPQFTRSGNPDLKPVLSNTLELTYSYFGKGSISFSVSYASAGNDVQQVTTFKDSASYTTYGNVGKNKATAINASINYPFSDNLSFTVNSSLTYMWIEGFFNSVLYRNQGLKGYAYSNLSYKMKKGFFVTLTATFVSTDVRLQGSTNGYIFNTCRVSKELMNKRILVSAFLSNPFKEYRQVVATTNTETFQQTVNNQRFYRMFGGSISYGFGNLKSEIKKNKKSISNDDTINKSN